MAWKNWLTNRKRPAGIVVLALFFALCRIAPATAGYASYIVDAETGRVIHAVGADDQNHPASLTKMMTLYMVFEALDAGRLKLTTPVPVSQRAASQAPSRLGLAPGQSLSVENAILALVTKSANDIACALAEAIGGSEVRFAQMMTDTAHRIGMPKTQFRNASGLPNSGQITTAHDMATLARALIRTYPQYYHYFSTKDFQYGEQRIPTHNRLLLSYQGADGLKTGYIAASGFNLVTSAKRDGRRLIGVVLGGNTARWRDQHMADLLDASFAQIAGEPPPARARVRAPQNDVKAAVAKAKKGKANAKGKKRHEGTQAKEKAKAKKPRPDAAAPGERPGKVADGRAWAVQVGAFQTARQAEAAAKLAGTAVRGQKPTPDIRSSRSQGQTVYRARLAGLTEAEARAICAKRQRDACRVLAPSVEVDLVGIE